MVPRRLAPAIVVAAFLAAGCSDTYTSDSMDGAESVAAADTVAAGEDDGSDGSSAGDGGGRATDRPGGAAPSSTVPSVEVSGTVTSAATGDPLAGAVVTSGGMTSMSDEDGGFTIAVADGATVSIRRAAWEPVETVWTGDDPELNVELEPLLVRGLRVSSYVAADPAMFAELLDLAEATSVNTLVFDTKDETNLVLYASEVEVANEIGAVEAVYDPEALVAEAEERGFYTITRIVTFEDELWADTVPGAKLAGAWVDAANPDNWRYPIALAVEACRLGFDEIQFDYVRFPSGQTAVVAADLVPPSEEERTAAIATFLAEARAALLAEGCGVSAAIFGIVMSSETDERLGQTPETIAASVDAISPMLYPSHYSPGWLGFADPNDHPGPVIAHALDTGAPKLGPDVIVRPWIQGFYYNGEQVLAQIREAEARGAGWIIWNASGSYDASWLPPAEGS